MDQTTDTLVLDTAWEIQEVEQRFERHELPPQNATQAQTSANVRVANQSRLPYQVTPAPSIGEKLIADAIRWVSARVWRKH